jgi:BlaI family penicillinase repressor
MKRTKPELPLLTRAESELMRLFWEHGPMTVHEVAAGVGRELAYNTVLTLVRILEQKGYVTHSPHPDGGRAHVYRAAEASAPVRSRHVRDLVDRLFGGSAEGLMVGLLEDEALSRGELEQLRAQIETKLGKARKGRS